MVTRSKIRLAHPGQGKENPMTKEELMGKIAYYRDCQLAELVTLIIGVAVERHPEEIRRALGLVFDLSGVEFTTQGVMALVQEAHQKAVECRAEVRELQKELGKLLKKLESLEQRLEKNRS